MAIVVQGKCPDDRVGEWFHHRGNWKLIENCVYTLAEDDLRYIEWCTPAGCIVLAEILASSILNGGVDRYVADRNYLVDIEPREMCYEWGGTGTLEANAYRAEDNSCVACEATGMARKTRSHQDLYVGDFREFAQFLRHSGGYSVHDNAPSSR